MWSKKISTVSRVFEYAFRALSSSAANTRVRVRGLIVFWEIISDTQCIEFTCSCLSSCSTLVAIHNYDTEVLPNMALLIHEKAGMHYWSRYYRGSLLVQAFNWWIFIEDFLREKENCWQRLVRANFLLRSAYEMSIPSFQQSSSSKTCWCWQACDRRRRLCTTSLFVRMFTRESNEQRDIDTLTTTQLEQSTPAGLFNVSVSCSEGEDVQLTVSPHRIWDWISVGTFLPWVQSLKSIEKVLSFDLRSNSAQVSTGFVSDERRQVAFMLRTAVRFVQESSDCFSSKLLSFSFKSSYPVAMFRSPSSI